MLTRDMGDRSPRELADTCGILARELVRELCRRRMKLATAESCTGGLVAKYITDVDGASAVFDCGIVAYANGIKKMILGVREDTLASYGAVSEQTAREMAEGVRRLAGASLGIGITGIAGPASDGTDKKPGLIFLGLACEQGTRILRLNNTFTEHIRESNRQAAAAAALEMAAGFLSGDNTAEEMQ